MMTMATYIHFITVCFNFWTAEFYSIFWKICYQKFYVRNYSLIILKSIISDLYSFHKYHLSKMTSYIVYGDGKAIILLLVSFNESFLESLEKV